MTRPNDSAHGTVHELHFDSHKFQVQCNEADVRFSIWGAEKTSQQSNRFDFDQGYQVMLRPKWTDHQDMCEGPKCGKMHQMKSRLLKGLDPDLRWIFGKP